MSGTRLAAALKSWIETTLHAPGASDRDHCVDLRARFRIPGAGRVDLLSLRHARGKPDRFRVDLWTILPRAIDEDDLDPVLRRLHAFRAWYGDLVEHAETQGFSPKHHVSVCGNLVGTELRAGPLTDLLSHSGSSVFFWTWSRHRGVFTVAPAYGRAPALAGARSQLRGLLNHLPWEDTVEREVRVRAART